MHTLLEIKKPKSNSFIIWEHVMKTVFTFMGTFAILIFVPLMLGGKSSVVPTEDRLAYSIVDYLFHHPEIQIGIPIAAAALMNIYLIFKNRKIKYIVKIEHNASNIQFDLTNLYFSKQVQMELPLSDLEFYLENKVNDDNEKQQKIVFRNAVQNVIIGEIKPDHIFWSERLLHIREVIHELNAHRTPNVSNKSRIPGIGTFWK